MPGPSRPPAPTRPGRLTTWGFRALVLGLIGLNGWWAWGDYSPPKIKAIDQAIARGQLDQAERDLARRVRWSPGDGEARMKLARLLIRRGDNLGGARQLHLVPAWWPARTEASFLEGQAFKLADRAVDAEAAWKSCIVDDPLHPAPSRLFHGAAKDLVTLYVLEGRIEEARKTLWRAFEEATPAEKPGVLSTRSRLELERIDHAQAAGRLREFVAADPEDWAARRALALEEHATHDEAGADRDIDACLKARPDDPLAWRAKLEILNDRGEVDALRSLIDRLPPSAEGDARTWMARGLARQRDGDRPGALAAFRKAEGLDPLDPEILYKLGMAEQLAGDRAPAREHIARSQQLYKAYNKLGEAHHEFLDQSRKAPRDEAGYRAAIEQMAAVCRQLGWQREADAWRAQIAQAP